MVSSLRGKAAEARMAWHGMAVRAWAALNRIANKKRGRQISDDIQEFGLFVDAGHARPFMTPAWSFHGVIWEHCGLVNPKLIVSNKRSTRDIEHSGHAIRGD